MFQHIVPALLDRIFDQDNNRQQFLWGMGQQGGVSGDCFVKVAYAEPGTDAADPISGRGRVLLLVLQPSHCFPVWHPHIPGKMTEFKLKYKFWGCVDTKTEALTRSGWKTHDQIAVGDEILSLDPDTDEITWKPAQAVNVYDYDGPMVKWAGRIDAVTTLNHRWLAERERGNSNNIRHEREIVRTDFPMDGDASIRDLRQGSRLVAGGGVPLSFATTPKWSDELVETVGWYLTEGADHYNQTGFHSVLLGQKKPEHVTKIRRLMSYWCGEGATFNEYKPDKNGVIQWYLGKGIKDVLEEAAPGKQLTPTFLSSLTYRQARVLRDVLLDGDGNRRGKSVRWTQIDAGRQDGYQMLCAMLGIRTMKASDGEKVQEYDCRYIGVKTIGKYAKRTYTHDGKIWCPTVDGGVWFARRNGSTYWTGNTQGDGTRVVNTYCEHITNEFIKEYLNDELIRESPNMLGRIPIVHIANTPVSGSPWGLSDIDGVIPLNREYNEKATEVSDILNYHVAPITIITGGSAPNLEKGPAKIWGVKNEKAQVFNLEGGAAGLAPAMEYLELLRMRMHEYGHVPANALGEEQAISNTSGVALAIQFMPTMMWYGLKKIQFGAGLREICQLALMTLFMKEPEALIYDPNTDGVLDPMLGQQPVISPDDPAVYDIEINWPAPLPTDVIIKLDEIERKMGLNLESRKGALRDLNEEFPDEKILELEEELMSDAKTNASLTVFKAQVAAAVMELTGVIPPEMGEPVPPEAPEPGSSASGSDAPQQVTRRAPTLPPGVSSMSKEVMSEIVTNAFMPRVPLRRQVDKNDS